MVVRAHPEPSKAWSIGFVVAVCGVIAAYFFLPVDTKNSVFNVVAVATAAAMFVGIGQEPCEPRFAWILLASGTLLMAVGDIVFGSSTNRFHRWRTCCT